MKKTPAIRAAVVISRYNASITDRLLDGAKQAWATRGLDPGLLEVLDAPGSYELPAVALAAAESGRFDGVAALGCLIHGQTLHDRYIAQAVALGLVQVTIKTGIPATFGVLTVESAAQARARAGGREGNKGADAIHAMLDVIAVTRSIRAGVRSSIARGRDKASGLPSGRSTRGRR